MSSTPQVDDNALLRLHEHEHKYFMTASKLVDYSKYKPTTFPEVVANKAVFISSSVLTALFHVIQNYNIMLLANQVSTFSNSIYAPLVDKLQAHFISELYAYSIYNIPKLFGLTSILGYGVDYIHHFLYPQKSAEFTVALDQQLDNLRYEFPCITGWNQSFMYDEDANMVRHICSSSGETHDAKKVQDKNDLIQHAYKLSVARGIELKNELVEVINEHSTEL